MEIRFGTDGWRAVMCDTFILKNVRIVAEAIASYLAEERQAQKGVVIGYDTRFFSKEFAEACSGVFQTVGIPVYMVSNATPTPVVAFAVKAYKAAGAIMITASHNPPKYNGIKFIPYYAGPATKDITEKIERNVRKIVEGKRTKGKGQKQSLKVKHINPQDKYFNHIKKLIDFENIKKAKLKIVLDPLYGAGQNIFPYILRKTGSKVISIHNFRDAFFGDSLPDPSGKNLLELSSYVKKEKAHLGLALDGDGDRFGVVSSNGVYLSPNQTLPLVAEHLIKNRSFKGVLVRSVATTHLLDRVAEFYGVKLFETPVGFKYIGEVMRRQSVILGGEESAGLSILGHIPEKDGILANLLLAEVVAYERKSLSELLKDAHRRYGKYVSERLDIECSYKKKEALMTDLRNHPPPKVKDMVVSNVVTLDGVKLIFEDGSWLLARPSGTESIIRVYIESESLKNFKILKSFSRKLIGG